jgi:hypothetical protein
MWEFFFVKKQLPFRLNVCYFYFCRAEKSLDFEDSLYLTKEELFVNKQKNKMTQNEGVRTWASVWKNAEDFEVFYRGSGGFLCAY